MTRKRFKKLLMAGIPTGYGDKKLVYSRDQAEEFIRGMLFFNGMSYRQAFVFLYVNAPIFVREAIDQCSQC